MSGVLDKAVAALHVRMDDWAAAVEGVSAEFADDRSEALADPRLEAAQDAFYEALADFERETLPLLGLTPVAAEDEVGEADATQFAVTVLVTKPVAGAAERLGSAQVLVDEIAQDLVDRLGAEGFEVQGFGTSRADLLAGDDEPDADDEAEDGS